GSGIPIYRQIIDQVRRLVASGALRAGDELPSIRQAAGHYEINPMTISKAYSLLEAAGVLERVRGQCMIVAAEQTGERNLKKRLELLQPALREAAAQARQLDIPRETVLKTLSELLEESNE
ncbi:MAG: GntR family transcriptional regulator, partial [Acidobacteriota bacterium]|nr:GntR family transcriptional regulator [Acidobacteriota bacterium]